MIDKDRDRIVEKWGERAKEYTWQSVRLLPVAEELKAKGLTQNNSPSISPECQVLGAGWNSVNEGPGSRTKGNNVKNFGMFMLIVRD